MQDELGNFECGKFFDTLLVNPQADNSPFDVRPLFFSACVCVCECECVVWICESVVYVFVLFLSLRLACVVCLVCVSSPWSVFCVVVSSPSVVVLSCCALSLSHSPSMLMSLLGVSGRQPGHGLSALHLHRRRPQHRTCVCEGSPSPISKQTVVERCAKQTRTEAKEAPKEAEVQKEVTREEEEIQRITPPEETQDTTTSKRRARGFSVGVQQCIFGLGFIHRLRVPCTLGSVTATRLFSGVHGCDGSSKEIARTNSRTSCA
jgi:hypothetical protein